VPVTERPKLLTVPQTARLLACGRDKVYDLLHRGEIEGVMLDGRRRIVRESLDAFVRRLREAS